MDEQYSYDIARNRIKYANDKGTMEFYNYNEVNELIGIKSRAPNCEISEIINFIYDSEGLRHETEENGFTRYIRGNRRFVASDCESARTYYHISNKVEHQSPYQY